MSMVGGTPKWAELKKDRDEDADSDDEFFRVRRFCFEKFGLLHFSILVTYLFDYFPVQETRTLIQL